MCLVPSSVPTEQENIGHKKQSGVYPSFFFIPVLALFSFSFLVTHFAVGKFMDHKYETS